MTTATDLHQRMLHQLDRVKAMNTSPSSRSPQGVEQKAHVSQLAGTDGDQPHIPAVNDAAPGVEPQAGLNVDIEDRSEPRERVHQQGLVVYSGQEQGVACEIRDLTSAGAKLRLGDDVTVPSCLIRPSCRKTPRRQPRSAGGTTGNWASSLSSRTRATWVQLNP